MVKPEHIGLCSVKRNQSHTCVQALLKERLSPPVQQGLSCTARQNAGLPTSTCSSDSKAMPEHGETEGAAEASPSVWQSGCWTEARPGMASAVALGRLEVPGWRPAGSPAPPQQDHRAAMAQGAPAAADAADAGHRHGPLGGAYKSVGQAEGLSPSARRPEHGSIRQGTGRCRSPTPEREETPFFTPLPAVPASWAGHACASEAPVLMTSARSPLAELKNSSKGPRTCAQRVPVRETPDAQLQADRGHIVGLAERSSTCSTSSSARHSAKHSEASTSSSSSLSSPATAMAGWRSPRIHSEAPDGRRHDSLTEHGSSQSYELQGCQVSSGPATSAAEGSIHSSPAEVSQASGSCVRTHMDASISACSSSAASARGASQLPDSSFWGAPAGALPGQALQSPLPCPRTVYDAQGSHLRHADPPDLDADALCHWPGEHAPTFYPHRGGRPQSCLGLLC